MTTLDVLYIVLSAAVVVVTVVIVWLAGDLKEILRSLKKTTADTEAMTTELREKVHMVAEAIDRVGTTATRIIGLIEDAVETVKEKKDQIVSSLGLVSGIGQYYKNRKNDSQTKESDGEKKSEGGNKS